MNSFIETRNRHFTEACRRIIRSLPARTPIDVAAVAAQASMSPAPCYYCTYGYALRVLRVVRHGRLQLRNDRRAQMFYEIYGKCKARMERTGENLPTALNTVLATSRASRFFISHSTARRLAYELLQGK